MSSVSGPPEEPHRADFEGDEHLARERRPLADIPPIPSLHEQMSSAGTALDSTDVALSLVDQAADTIAYLLARNRYLEERGREVSSWVKDRLEEMQQRLDAAERGKEDVEQKLQNELSRRVEMEKRIKAAFGVGSKASSGIQEARAETEGVLTFGLEWGTEPNTRG